MSVTVCDGPHRPCRDSKFVSQLTLTMPCRKHLSQFDNIGIFNLPEWLKPAALVAFVVLIRHPLQFMITECHSVSCINLTGILARPTVSGQVVLAAAIYIVSRKLMTSAAFFDSENWMRAMSEFVDHVLTDRPIGQVVSIVIQLVPV